MRFVYEINYEHVAFIVSCVASFYDAVFPLDKSDVEDDDA